LLPIAPPSGLPRNPNVLLIRTHPNPAPSVANNNKPSPCGITQKKCFFAVKKKIL
jgi:hypothetical protein